MKRFAEATAELKRLEADLELKIAALRGSYAEQVAHYKDEQQAIAERLQRYAQDNYGSLFAKGKSHDLRHGSIGFRQGQPQVLKSRSTTWVQLLERFKELRMPFVRVKEEPDKQAIIATRKAQPPPRKGLCFAASLLRVTEATRKNSTIRGSTQHPEGPSLLQLRVELRELINMTGMLMQHATIERTEHHRLKRFEVLLKLLIKVHDKSVCIVDNLYPRRTLRKVDRSAPEEGLAVQLMNRHQRQDVLKHRLLASVIADRGA